MPIATDALRLELERQIQYLKHTDTRVADTLQHLAACQAEAARLRKTIAELEAAIATLERPTLAVVRPSRL